MIDQGGISNESENGATLPGPRGRAALFTVVAAGAAFMFSLAAVVLWVATLPRHAAAAAAPAGGLPDAPPLADEAERDEPGLALTFTRAEAKDGDTRVARLAALYVPAGAAPTPFLDAGPFVATWEGELNLRIRDTFAFSAEGRGKLTVTIKDAAVLDVGGDDLSQKRGEPVRLNKGKNHVVIRYESPAAGDASVRLFWAARDESMPQPIPPQVWTHNAGATAIAAATRVRDGRLLFAQLRCVKCHAAGDATGATGATGGMPELAMDAPSLTDAGARLTRDWVALWVNNPRALRPDAHMPRVFAGAGAEVTAVDARAADVAAYLASLGIANGADAAAPAADEQVALGGQLFASLNCAACHPRPDADEPVAAEAPEGAGGAETVLPRVSLKLVRLKFTGDALKQYLSNPHAHYAWNPMPNFHPSAEEAAGLAAFLVANGADKLPAEVPAGDPTKGKALVESSGCLNCHAVGEQKSSLKSPALAELSKDGWAKGLAKDADFHKAGPRYGVTDAERAALVAFAATDRSSLRRDAAPEFAERQIAAMRCAACHARDANESLLATAYDAEQKELEAKYPPPQPANAEAFAPDQRPPLLTWAGEKLRPEWTAAFVAGQIPYKPRPYLRARMPAFPARAAGIAAGLAEGHGCPPTSAAPPKPDAAMATVGQKLTGKTPNEAFACVQCHAVGPNPPLAPFEAPAVNFAHASERLRKDYYHRWVHNPLKFDPNTKMPAFERDDGKTTITNVYDGDARKQFEAIWQYLLNGKDIKPPAD